MIKIEQKLPEIDKIKQDIDKAVEDSFRELNVKSDMQEGYDQSTLQVRSGSLYSSYLSEPEKDQIKVKSNLPYARIQDLGGHAGRNNSAYIRPTGYFQLGIERLKESFLKILSTKLK